MPSIHPAEAIADYPGKETVIAGAPILCDNVRKWIEFREYKDFTKDFAKLGEEL